jgi:hypothetical protein
MIEMSRLVSLAMLMLVGCATFRASRPMNAESIM